MGFLLDMLDDPNAMRALLGGNTMGGPSPTPMPMPPASAMPQGQGGIDSQPQMNGNPAVAQSLLDNSGYDPGSGVASAPGMTPPSPPLNPQTPDFANGVPLPPADPRLANASAGVPMPPSAPGQAPPLPPPINVGHAPIPVDQPPAYSGGPSNAMLPPGATPTGFPGSPPPQGGPPLPPASAMPGYNPSQPAGAPRTFTQQLTDPNNIRAALSGIGRGFSAVGNAPPGATMGQMLGRGIGGSLQGTTAAQEQQKTQDFNQASTYFRDMLAAKAQNNAEAFNAAREKYFLARAQGAMTGTNNGSRTLNSPAAITGFVEGKALQLRDQLRKEQMENNKVISTPITPDTLAQGKKDLEAEVDAYRQRTYKQFGLSPAQVEQAKNAGLTQANPIDTSKMSHDEFNTQVPYQGYYDSGKKYGADGTYTGVGPDGQPRTLKGAPGKPVILQRQDRPGVPNEAPAAGQGQPGAAQTYYDDQAALNPA